MRRCISSLRLVLQQQYDSRTSARRHRGKKRNESSTVRSPARDDVGMTIPESRLRRNGVSLDVFDRSIEERSRDILGLDEDATNQRRTYGADFDRREVRFQGSSNDLRQFAEMAARAEATKKWNDSLQRQQDGECKEFLPLNAVAYVRQPKEEIQKEDGAPDETKKSVKSGSSALLHRALRHHSGEAFSMPSSILEKDISSVTTIDKNGGRTSLGTAVNDSTTIHQISESKRRAERRRRRLERVLGSEGNLHPCVHQGGCAVHAGATTLCPFVMYPSTVCVMWLRDGRCDDAVSGCCPWWHGNLAGTARTEISAHCLFHTAEDNPDLGGKQEQLLLVQESCTWMGTLLQMFWDLLTVDVAEEIQRKLSGKELSVEELQQYLEQVLSDGMGAVDLAVNFESSRGILTVERELGLSGLMAVENINNEEEETFDEMFTRQLTSMQNSHTQLLEGEMEEVEKKQQQQQGEEHQILHDSSEQRLRRVLSIFRGYITECDDNNNRSGSRIALCTPLTKWILCRAAQHYYDTHHKKKIVESTPQELFEEASTVLLQHRLEMFDIFSEGNDLSKNSHQWSAILLLQQATLLARIPASNRVSPITGATIQRSLLYKLLLLAHTKGNNTLWPGDTVHTQYINCWVFLQSFLSTISLRILRQSTSLFAFARSAIIGITRQLAQDVEEDFSHPLLRANGWLAWTDAQMFAPHQMENYTAIGYAQHHLPVIRHSFVVSALNVFLLHIGREASNTYQLHWSPLKAVLFSRGGDVDSPLESLERERRLYISSSVTSRNNASKRGIRLRQSIRPYAQEALAIFSALQDESNTVETRRQLLMEEFMMHRMEYQERTESDIARRRNKSITNTNTTTTTNKGNRNSTWASRKNRRNHHKNDESNGVECVDHLPPHGSVMVAADAVGHLLRLLLEGGWAYKSLRLAATALYTAQKPHEKNEKREKEEKEEMKEKKRGTGELWLQLDGVAIAAVAAVAMRLPAGGRLVRTVIGGRPLRDSTARRCLPVPNRADVHPQNGTIAAASGARILRAILALLSDDNNNSGNGKNSNSDRNNNHTQPIGVTARVMEVVVTQTPNSDREAHSNYERIAGMDPRTRVNDSVLLAQQYHWGRHHFARANGVAAAVWMDFVQSNITPLSGPTALALHKEMEQLPSLIEEHGFTLQPQWKHKYQQQISQSIRTIEELRTHLQQQDQHSSEHATPTNASYQQRGYMWYVSRVLATHVTDSNSLHRMRWAVVSGVLLAINDDKLTGVQRSWSRLLLRNAFILAHEATTQQERSRLTEATVRLFLISDFFDPESTATNAPERLPWSSAVVRDLPQFISAQIQLAQKLTEKIVDTHGALPPQYDCHLLSQFKTVAELNNNDDSHTVTWQLLEPFIQHPELALHWLNISFFRVPHDLIAWIIARLNKNDAHSIQCLAVWVTFLYQNGATTSEFHAAAMRLVGKRCTPQQVQKIHDFLHANTHKDSDKSVRPN
ncbi:uncharacterized protein TM35_000101310 [Trypanosoma theileri]|uniref:Uncharacterized protein n=1 Tax=Trypanosoma theileri TaxID=67003 RepID=A0A1X0NZE5_9TRYP|nr:uncharacterized protein TM35_000101310 [Trypanosoma theileri]ORC89863.1 hypothetical protein TM35_000101310 [Trypanosoma theileri]